MDNSTENADGSTLRDTSITSSVASPACVAPSEFVFALVSDVLFVPGICGPVRQNQSLVAASWQPASLSLQVPNKAWHARLSPNRILVGAVRPTVRRHVPRQLRQVLPKTEQDPAFPLAPFSQPYGYSLLPVEVVQH